MGLENSVGIVPYSLILLNSFDIMDLEEKISVSSVPALTN